MNVFESAFERRLKKQISDHIETRSSAISAGSGISDFATYQNRVGYLAGLRAAKEIMEQVTADLNREENLHAANGDEA